MCSARGADQDIWQEGESTVDTRCSQTSVCQSMWPVEYSEALTITNVKTQAAAKVVETQEMFKREVCKLVAVMVVSFFVVGDGLPVSDNRLVGARPPS